jgi:secreted trypsin-like serine protease
VTTPAIVGGSTATEGSFGYTATVIYYNSSGNPQFLCSGTLVSSNVVLTAGHCGANETTGVADTPSGYRIVTNTLDWDDATGRVISGVSQVDVNPNFNPTTLYGDAALLVLSAPVTSPTIPLWTSGQFAAGTGATIAGWGDEYSGQLSATTTLQWAPTVLQNTTYCTNEADGAYDYDSDTELCAVNPPYYATATCNGDSGGPLLADNSEGVLVEIGLTSAGPTDCNTDTADFFTAVEPIASWIETEITAAAPAVATTTTTTPTATTTTTTATTQTATTETYSTSLGRLTSAAAHTYAGKVLAGVFRGPYRHASSKEISCARITAARFDCSVNFSSGAKDYYGNIVVYLAIGAKNGVYWTDSYTLHAVNDHCYFHSGHRRQCKVATRRGMF